MLYDPLYTMKTTIAGQMLLSLWSEKLVEAEPRIKFIQHNTDGISYMIPKDSLPKIHKVSEYITKTTGLFIEDSEYKKFIILNVNNYIAQYTNGQAKHKGCFEIDKELHKNSSMRIVPIALSNYFLKGIPINDTILNHDNIYDFCLKLKINNNSRGLYRSLEDGVIKDSELSKTTRYFVSNKGGILLKKLPKSLNGVNVGYTVTLFNRYYKDDMLGYDINYKFYERECMKIIHQIEDKQLELF